MVCFLCGEGPKIFVSPENYGDWRSARSRSSVLGTAGRLGEEPKDFLSPENYGDWRSARSRSSVLSVWKSTSVPGAIEGISLGDDVAALAPSSGEDPTLPRHRAGTRRKFDFHTGGDRGPTGGGTKRFFISRELWRLEIRAVEEQRPFWELPWRPRAGLRRAFKASSARKSARGPTAPAAGPTRRLH